MPYTGGGKNPYWASLGYAGTANAGMLSENVPLVTDGVTTYSLRATACTIANWASGFRVIVSYFNAVGGSTGTSGYTTSAALTAGVNVTVSTTAALPPAGTAYCTLGVELVGAPATTNVLQVFEADLLTGSNTAQPAALNQNYAFIYTTDPWAPYNNGVLTWNFDPLTSADGDYDSLVIDNLVELMGGQPGVQCGIPECTDPATGRSAIYRIPFTGGSVGVSAGGGGPYDLGAPQPTQDVVQSMLLDGERPFGDRASNRTITIPVLIFAPSLNTLAAAREALLKVVDQQTWKLTWRPAASGLPLEFDCFRALPSVVTYGFQGNQEAGNTANPANWAKGLVTLTFQALPYGKSGQDGLQVVNFADGILGAGTVLPSVSVDNFASVSGTGWSLNTAYAFGGSQSAKYSAPVPMRMPWAAAAYGKSGLSLNLSGLRILTLWFGQSYDTQWPNQKTFVSNVTLNWTLTDANSNVITFSGKQNKCVWGANPNRPAWTRISATIPQGKKPAQFDYSRVTAYSVRITNWAGSGTTGYVRMHAWMSQISATAQTTKRVTTPHGSVYSVFGTNSMARSPLTATVQLAAQNPVTHELTKSGMWTVPSNVTLLQLAEGWGAGGGGGSVNAVTGGFGGAGGGGAEYAAEANVTVIPGTQVPFSVGAGGSGGQVVMRQAVFAQGGPNTWQAPGGTTSISCFAWGGGAAGCAGGGGGGAGAYTEGTLAVTAGSVYTFTVGKGGVPNWSKLAKDQATRHGGDTVVRGDTAALHANGGLSPVTGGTNGGTGAPRYSGTGVTFAASGGNGGNSPGGAGGGGGGSGSNNGNGNRGGDSPKGSNNYGSGGPGAPVLLGSNGGAGGNGADVSGTPTPGQAPGGGGGGGYTKGVNNNGAAGAPGKIVIKWQENLGNPVAGGATVFGQAGLTNKVITAHGGASPGINSADGGGGGTGSSNTAHFDGGKGSYSGNNFDYLFRSSENGGPFFQQATAAGTTASLTTSAAANAHTTGLSIVTVVSATPLDGNAAVTDSAGNLYDWVAKADVTGTMDVNVYIAKIGNPVTTSTTVNVANNSVSNTLTVTWYGTVQYADIDWASVVSAVVVSNATSATTAANADIGTHKGMFTTWVNNSSADISTDVNSPASTVTTSTATSKFASGTVFIHHRVKELPGATGTNTYSIVYGSAVNSANITIPLIPQDTAEPTLLKAGSVNSTGTTSNIALTSSFAIPAGRGQMLLVCHFAGTPGTVTFTDSAGNTFTQKTTVTIGSSTVRTYTAPVTNAYTTASSVQLNDTTSQLHVSALYYVPEASGLDAAITETNTGTDAAPTVTTNAGNSPNDFEVVIVSNNNSVDVTSTPSGWVNWGNNFSGSQHSTVFAKRQHGRTAYTFTSAYAGSQAWGVSVLGFTNKVLSGSGGSSGGPTGTGQDGSDNGGSGWSGGGKGANGLTGAYGPGAAAAVPGGGGSGAAASDTSALVGGSGGAGMVRLTWQPPLQPFNDLILHRPGQGAKRTLCPIVTIPPNDPPDNREYSVPSLVAGRNAEFWGTYTVLVVANSWNAATFSTSRRLSVTVNQYEYTNGPACSVQATTIITPANDIVNGYVDMGPLTLPIKDYDESNDQVYYTVSVHDTDQGDSFQDVLFLDTTGQTVLCNIAPGTAGDSRYSTFYIDEPTFDRGMGQVLGSGHGREEAISVLDMTLATGGPLYLDGGENLLLAYSTSGAPDIGVEYLPRWYSDRVK